MALVLKDRVLESSTSSGTGSITLAGALTGYQTFNSVVASGSTVYYTIHNTTSPNDGEFEVGVGTFTSPSTLTRDTVFSSSAGGTTKVNFTGSSTLEVFITQPAEQAVYINDATGKVEIFGNGTNTVAFTNVTADLFTGNGSALTAINASNVSTGTIANARTTAASANGASTIVQRDSGGSFDANLVNAVSLSGNAATVTGINASNIASGTIANARTTASSSNGASTIVLRGASGEFAAGVITGDSFSGNGSALTAINATAITTGTLDNARTTASSANGASTIVARDANGSFSGNVGTFVTISGAHSGNGAGLTDINASNISTGTISNARTTADSANGASTIVARDASGNFTANAGIFTSVSGNGSSLTNINASNISSGTIDNVRTTASSSNGASTIVLRGTSGEFSAGAITGDSFTGNGAAISAINASNIASGTIDNARTTGASANGASTLVLRDANGSFAGNVITGTTGTFTSVSGNGVALTAINASNVSSGTLSAQYGGTGSANLTAENVILGNGASTVKVVAPGTASNVLTSNGTTWISQAPGGGANAATPTAEGTLYGSTGSGFSNTSLGYEAGNSATSDGNVFIGHKTGRLTTNGDRNVFVGQQAAENNATGNFNCVIGWRAGYVLDSNGMSALGYQALRSATGANNTAIGFNAGFTGTNDLTTGTNNILIGANAQASASTVSNETTIGNSSTTSARIFGDLKFLKSYTEEVFAVTGTTPALSPTNGTIQTWTLSGNSTPTAGTWAAGQSITLMIDDGSAFTVTWSSLAVTWKTNAGVAPTLNTTGFTVITLWKVGSVIYGARVGDA